MSTLRHVASMRAARLAGTVGLVAGACASPPAPAPAPPPATAIVLTVAPERVTLTSEWIATLDGLTNAQIRPQVSGYLIARPYREGGYVRTGQVLFEIDARPFQAVLAQTQARLAEARAQLSRAERDVRRDTPLAEQRAIAQSQLDNDLESRNAAQAAVQSAEASVQTAQLNLDFTKVTSLIDGIAAIATAQIGDLVSPATLLTTVSQVDPIKVYFPLSEPDYLRLAGALNGPDRGQPWAGGLTLILADGSVYPHGGAFLAADREIDAKTGTIRVSATFPNSAHTLRPGQFGRVRAGTQALEAALLVPQRAVSELQGGSFVRIVGPDNRVATRTVVLGDRVGNRWIVKSGLQPGDRVVVESPTLRDGATVVPKPYGTGGAGSAMISNFFIRRPIVAIVISILTVLVGLVALAGLPISQFPQIVPPQILVTGVYTGADASTIEQSVATPLEQQVNGVDNMLYMQSTNANDGTMTLTVTFDVESDPNVDQVNVQNRMAQAQPNLPPEINQFGLTMRKQVGLPMLIVGLSSPGHTYSSLFLANYANINIIDALYRVPGVGEVRVFGASDYAMRIWVRPADLARLGLTIPDLSRAIQQQSAVNPSGQIGSPPAPTGQEMTYTVRSQGRLQTPEEFARVIVRAMPGGAVVRLADVARIELGAVNYQQIGRVNGEPGCSIGIFQAPGSNALQVAQGVKRAMTEIETRLPQDLKYAYVLDSTLAVSEGIREMLWTLGEAMLLVVLVVYLFLQNWRATLIPMVAVPVSLIGTFALFPALGFSVNTLSLFGLILAIGLVVDDAIVVVEAVEHHIEHGLSAHDATVTAMHEVSGPVVSIAVILAAVFVPVGFMHGIQGRLNQQFALTIAISVLISAFNALTLSPALSAMLLRPRTHRRLAGRLFGAFNRGFDLSARGYLRASGLLIRKAVIGVLLLALFGAGAVGLGRRLPSSFIPEEDYGYFLLNVTLPPAASLERTDAICREVDRILASTPGVNGYATIVGFSLLTRVTASNNGFYFVGLRPWTERTPLGLNGRRIVNQLNARMRRELPEGAALATMPPAIPGLGTQGGFTMWLQDRSGGSIEFLNGHLQRFLTAARQRPELQNVDTPFSAAVPQLFVEVDRDKALKQGVALGDVYQTMQTFLGGLYVNQFNRFGRQWRVFLQAEGTERMTPDRIGQFYVRNNDGTMVPLSTLESTRPTAGPQYTNRFNVYRAVQVTGSAAPGFSSGQALDTLEEVAQATLPPEISHDWGDLSYQERRFSGSAAPMFALSILVVFLVLAALYESWSLPFSVLLSVPIAMVGAFAGLAMRRFDLNVYAQIGLVMLVGLAAKNAILIVEFAKARRERGQALVDAALEGARVRLRPIVMTSLAFIVGCVPLCFAEGAGAAARQILGTAVVAGMLLATVIAVMFIPMLYVTVERIFGRRSPAPSPAAPIEPEAAS